jgi:hypothetical protein
MEEAFRVSLGPVVYPYIFFLMNRYICLESSWVPLLTFMNRVTSMAESKMSRATEIAIAIVTVVYSFYAC